MDVSISMAIGALPSARSAAGEISISQALMLALAVVGLVAVLLSGFARLRRKSPRRSVATTPPNTNPADATSRDIEELMVQLDDLARQIHGRLDTRLARLESLLHEADQSIERLTRLTRHTDNRQSIDVTLAEVDPKSEEQPLRARGSHPHAEIYRLADLGLSHLEIARQSGHPTGEVELVLSLRRARSPSAGDIAASPQRLHRAG